MNCNLENQAKEILNFIFTDMNSKDLFTYAKDAHGFVADEGAYWVLYSTDLDEYEVEVEEHVIPDEMVEIYLWGELEEGEVILLPLTSYLCALKNYLVYHDNSNGFHVDPNTGVNGDE